MSRPGASQRGAARARDDAAVRRIALVIVGAFSVWMAASWLGGVLGLPLALAFALDIACLALLGWAIVRAWSLWRARQEGRG